MDVTVFNKLKEFEYGGVKLREVASWAIWDENIENTEIIEKNIDNLKSNIVFVALNFGSKKPDWKDWKNFHCNGSGDKRLRELLSVPKFKGTYMTDLIKNYNDSDSGKAEKYFKSDETKRNIDLDFFFREIDLLETTNIEMYLFGRAVERLFKKFIMKHEKFGILKQKVIKCQRIPHYSTQVTDFMEVARFMLDLPGDKKPPKNPLPPLWN